MYLGIDIGGTKTLVAVFTDKGRMVESAKFQTPATYHSLLKELAINVANLSTNTFTAAAVAIPGKVDRAKGIALAFGNLEMHNLPIVKDFQKLLHCSVFIDNDANLAGLSEAMLIKQYDCVLYVTISTGIGTGIITHQAIDPEFADSEGGQILLEHKGRLQPWEDFAAGSAIVHRFGKRADEIHDKAVWKLIAHDIAIGLYDLIAFTQPDVVVLGGGVLSNFEYLETPLLEELKKYETPLTVIPPILRAKYPEQAVAYGCYYFAKDSYAKTH